MAGLAGAIAGKDHIVGALARTVETLRGTQGAQGQIASNYVAESGAIRAVSFGSTVPRLDSASWYLLGIVVAARAGSIDAVRYHDSARAVVALLDAIEYNGRHLLYVPVGGNWADEYIYDGYILYDQVLRAWALREAGRLYGEPSWIAKSDAICGAIERSFWPEEAAEPRRPIASFTPAGRRDLFDLAACALLAVSRINQTRGDAILDWIAQTFLDNGRLVPAFDPVITESHPEWHRLRSYHLYEFRNRPHHYHNGGVWPIWLGWLALAFARGGRTRDAMRVRDGMAAWVTAAHGWRFEEYFEGISGTPAGTPWMAYSAAGVVFLHHSSEAALSAVIP